MHEASKKDAEELRTRIMRTLDDLPPMHEVVMKAQEIMADPDSDMEDLVSIIETDQSIAVRILKLINSAYYGIRGNVSSIRQACSLLGLQTLREVIVTAGASRVLEKKLKGYEFGAGELWLHSIATGFCSRILAERKNPELVSDAYVGGLLHDAGKIILDQYVLERKDAFKDFMKDETKTVLDAERRILGFDHAEIASDMCRKWNIPENVTLAIQYHHYPSHSDENELAYIVHTADYLVRLSGLGYEADDLMHDVEEGALEFLGFKQENFSAIIFQVLEYVQKFDSVYHK
ncbi:MAG: HDOD domain-containing protein [Deltaproteobacteria bacterium]|nr:HDOD domain-containing protein [Deltaproteobacteria bacterium]MBW2021050.1 HDOD domain-containing protein [Deltaproteobacteria bacterium]